MPVRGVGTGNHEFPPSGGWFTCLCNYTLASYADAGTAAPAEGDYVEFTTSNMRVIVMNDDAIGNAGFGRVKGDPNTTDLTVEVEWFNVLGICNLECDDATTVTLLNSCIKDGADTVLSNVDAGGTSGNLIAVSKSATSGAIDVLAAVVITGK